MNANARQLAESKYRRGTVLGLTVAEIFILLLFLLMLVFLVLWQDLQVNQQEQQEELRNLREFYETWEKPLEGIEIPEEIETLKEFKEDLAQGDTDLLRDLAVARREAREAVEGSDRLQEELDQERRDHAQAKEQLSSLGAELRVLNKGQNPPCWYDLVPDGDGGMREKALYAFDIGVFDEHMVIRRREAPVGGAADDSNSTYADEWNDLRMADINYDEPLSNGELLAELQRIYDAGKLGDVRSYACIFSVRVWDETSSDAKARWQQAHDRTLEWLFGTFRVEDEPWEMMSN